MTVTPDLTPAPLPTLPPPPPAPNLASPAPTLPLPASRPPPPLTNLTNTQSESHQWVGRMRPDPSTTHHPAFPLLLAYATTGCPVDCGHPWTRAQLQAAVNRGAHPSARTPDAIACLHTETMEKVNNGFARLIPWNTLLQNLPKNLKVSPLAAVPHKSRKYRAILDLSFNLRIGGVKLPSVNESTTPLATHASMQQLGQVLPRLIAAVAAAAPDNGPIFFAKWDIKDGFWRMVVSDDDAWNFCYVLPGSPPENPIIVVPTSLQMGWCESPPFFCTATETARDLANELWIRPNPLPPHPLENLCLPPNETLPSINVNNRQHLFKLLEVYVDDFIGLIQAPSPQQLKKFTRAILHGIHKIFPPARPDHPNEDEPIALKKLHNGDGLWATSKEILGWIFDGINRCILLPPTKVTNLLRDIRNTTRRRVLRVRQLQQLQGRLIHASTGIPNGKGLLSPLIALVAQHHHQPRAYIPLDEPTRQALRDWRAVLRTATARPTQCTDLMPAPPDYYGYCDASKMGAGGVCFGITRNLPPIVWRVAFPVHIQQALVSLDNPHGTITNSALEMAGLLCQWLVLEHLADLTHAHVAIGCDNTPTVAWATRLLSTRDKTAGHLLRTLALRMIAVQASPITAFHIPGETNKMADLASRSFSAFPDNESFLTHFNSTFTLPQGQSWTGCQLHHTTYGKIFSTLQTTTSPMAWWQRITHKGIVFGGTGATSCNPRSIHSFKASIAMNKSPCYKPLWNGSGKDASDAAPKSKPGLSKTRWEPSARPLSWLASPTPPTNPAQTDLMPASNAN